MADMGREGFTFRTVAHAHQIALIHIRAKICHFLSTHPREKRDNSPVSARPTGPRNQPTRENSQGFSGSGENQVTQISGKFPPPTIISSERIGKKHTFSRKTNLLHSSTVCSQYAPPLPPSPSPFALS